MLQKTQSRIKAGAETQSASANQGNKVQIPDWL